MLNQILQMLAPMTIPNDQKADIFIFLDDLWSSPNQIFYAIPGEKVANETNYHVIGTQPDTLFGLTCFNNRHSIEVDAVQYDRNHLGRQPVMFNDPLSYFRRHAD